MSKKEKIFYGSVISILVILIICGTVYLIVRDNDDDINNGEVVTPNDTEENNGSDTVPLKIDETRDWVYDAEYDGKFKADSYKTQSDTYYARDIVVPYINVNSTYAKNENNNIKKIYDKTVNYYNEGVDNKLNYVDICSYEKYEYNNNVSVVLIYGYGATDVIDYNYYTSNINVNSGNKLSYIEAYKLAGFDTNNIEEKVGEAIKLSLSEVVKDNDLDNYFEESFNNYKKDVSNGTLAYFLNNEGKLKIIVTMSVPVGKGTINTLLDIN